MKLVLKLHLFLSDKKYGCNLIYAAFISQFYRTLWCDLNLRLAVDGEKKTKSFKLIVNCIYPCDCTYAIFTLSVIFIQITLSGWLSV